MTYYDELSVGQRFTSAPGVTLTDGLAAQRQAIVGGRLRLALDHALCAEVTGAGTPIADPGLVIDVAIGQSTVVTQRVIANLFYRGLALRRVPRIGDTLRTTVTIAALRDVTPRADRVPAGLAALHVVTRDQDDRAVLDFHRCAMLPIGPGGVQPGHTDDLDAVGRGARWDPPDEIAAWDLAALRSDATPPSVGTTLIVEGGDVVSNAPELARLTLNLATVHHDGSARPDGRRLVYGGHVVGLAAAQTSRVLANLVYLSAWHSCDHLAPVFEGDVLRTSVEVEASRLGPAGCSVLDLRVRGRVVRDGEEIEVLDWRPVAVTA
jgi:acyl dehydratase